MTEQSSDKIVKGEFDVGKGHKLNFEYTQDAVDRAAANGIDLLKEMQAAADRYAELIENSQQDKTTNIESNDQ